MDRREFMARWKGPVETAARRLLVYRQADYWLGEFAPARSLEELRAEVVRVDNEARDVKTFALRPNAHWRGFSAGQHVSVEVEIGGVRTQRVFSLSSAPSDPLLAITVKRMPGGRVSPWLHEQARPGHIVGLSPATGRFVLPSPLPPKLLLLSGGSGITPLMSILRDLDARDAVSDVVLVHHARAGDGVIFRDDLEAIAARRTGLRLAFCLSDGDGHGRFDGARLAELVPDFAERATFLCGPHGLMERAGQMWTRAGALSGLRRESFGLPASARPPGADASDRYERRIHLGRSGRSHLVDDKANLLDELERFGERLASGCRMGICQTCTCRKRRGVVRDLTTGKTSSDRDEEIQLCISAPQSDVELDL